MRSQVESTVLGRTSNAPASASEFARLADIEGHEPLPGGDYRYRVTFDGASTMITVRTMQERTSEGQQIWTEKWLAGPGSPLFESRSDCAFYAARRDGLFDS